MKKKNSRKAKDLFRLTESRRSNFRKSFSLGVLSALSPYHLFSLLFLSFSLYKKFLGKNSWNFIGVESEPEVLTYTHALPVSGIQRRIQVDVFLTFQVEGASRGFVRA